MDSMVNFSRFVFIRMATILDFLAPLFQLALRFYVANVFFKSGLTKIQDFSSQLPCLRPSIRCRFFPQLLPLTRAPQPN